MNRRNFIKGAVAATVAGLAIALPAVTVKRYGRIRASDPLGREVAKADVDGLDVTRWAYDGDDREGWIECHKLQDFPALPVDARVTELAPRPQSALRRVRIRGDVRFTMKVAGANLRTV